MTAEQMWKESGLTGEYEAWGFGADTDGLAKLVAEGKKRATSSAYDLYELDGEPAPKAGDVSIILDSKDNAVCIIKDTKVYVEIFRDVSAHHAALEGEGDLSLEYWRGVHRDFFTAELEEYGLKFDENIPVLCEEFEVIYPIKKQAD